MLNCNNNTNTMALAALSSLAYGHTLSQAISAFTDAVGDTTHPAASISWSHAAATPVVSVSSSTMEERDVEPSAMSSVYGMTTVTAVTTSPAGHSVATSVPASSCKLLTSYLLMP